MVLARQLLRRQKYYCDAYCGGILFYASDGDHRHSNPSAKCYIPLLMSEAEKGVGRRRDGGDKEQGDKQGSTGGKEAVVASAATVGSEEGEGEAGRRGDEKDWLRLAIGVGDVVGTSSTGSGQQRKRARSPDIGLALERPAPSPPPAGPFTSVGIEEALTWRLWDPGPSTEAVDPARESAPYGSTASTSGSTREVPGGGGGGEESSADIVRASSSRLPRPHTGVWLSLVAAENQAREPHLPQIPKSYLRVKDERTTVEVLMKYLANKLGLSRDNEVEMTCRGHPLQPSLTLQYVRDNIWCSPDLAPPSSDSPADVVMILNYNHSSYTTQLPTSV